MRGRSSGRLLLFILGFSVCAAGAFAQTYLPEKITFSGSSLSQADLLAFTGLHPGEAVTRERMQAASDKLTGTGLFADVRYAFDGEQLSFALMPSPAAVPVQYANFPWWDDRTLSAAVAARVPLFEGALNPGGSMRDQVSAALTSLLAAKGVQAAITTSPVGNADGNQVAILYRIDTPAVVVESVRIEGYSGVWTQPLEAMERSLLGQVFDGATRDQVAAAARAVYGSQGFIGMTMTDPVFEQPRVADGKIVVPIKASITSEGGQFRVSGVHLNGDLFMTQEQFQQRAKLHAGDVANQELWKQVEEMIAAPYRTHGYIHAKIDAAPVLDRANHTVDYTITIEPGAVYHMGKLTVVNVSEKQKAEILPYWPLREGEVYDAGRIPTFLNDYRRSRAPQLESIHNLEFSLKSSEDEETHRVDLVLTFPPQE